MKHKQDQGLTSEGRLADELKRRKLPFQHRVTIDYYEIDFLVGQRIVIEVDGYVHVTKASIAKDLRKDDYLKALGFTVLRITASDVKNRGMLREFGKKVAKLCNEERKAQEPAATRPMVQTMDPSPLVQLKQQLRSKQSTEQRCPQTTQGNKRLTDRELFLRWIERNPTIDKDEEIP